ncbi:glycosyltransferase [Alcanivorax sp. NBRC 102028]|uniref:glycosyltransferase n=1 Tax=Alcanivorax sp. NBRC 102028 TaxID=1113897 RepID=UPI000789C882|nr:glycosyltransferase [Alcanivorax sp. NBRC 102028]
MIVSIAMAVYNGEQYIRQQLESFISQDRLPDELVICDDGSTDGTVKIIEDMMVSFPFKVRLYKNEWNLGYCKNFEKAISICEGDLVFLSDQDDFWFKDKISTLCNWMEERPNLLIAQSDMEITDSNLLSSGVTQLNNFLGLGYTKNDFITGCGAVIRKKLLQVALPFPDSGWGHDNWLFSIGFNIGQTDVYERPLMYYRRHGSAASNHFASSVKKLSKWDALKKSGLSDATIGWKNEIQRCQDVSERICAAVESGLCPSNSNIINDNIRKLSLKIDALNYRIFIVGIPRWRRFFSAFLFWLRDGYKPFKGWKSFIKDCIRP